eukprot:IDg2644t1
METMNSRYTDTLEMIKMIPNCTIFSWTLSKMGLFSSQLCDFYSLASFKPSRNKKQINFDKRCVKFWSCRICYKRLEESKYEALSSNGYVIFKGFTNDEGLIDGILSHQESITNKLENEKIDLFEKVISDAPKDGETVDIAEPRPVSNKWTTICNRSDL